MNRPKIYVASRASIPERSEMWRSIKDRGADIVSSWIYEAGEGDTDDMSELWIRIEREVRACDRLVLYVGKDDFPLKGAYVEVGMAIAMGKPVFVVLDGVSLEHRTKRPLGSWAAHPSVMFIDDIETAIFGMPLETAHIDADRARALIEDLSKGGDVAERAKERLLSGISHICSERDQAHARAGSAIIAKADADDTAYRRGRWLSKAKREAGYDDNVSFDVVWQETLELARRQKASG